MISLRYVYDSKWEKFKRFSLLEFIATIMSMFGGGWYYVNDYQKDKHLILNGKFPMAHLLFMEVKEHLFITFFLISLFLQLRIYFTQVSYDKLFQKETKVVLYSMVFLGLMMAIMGLFVSMGFRVNLE